MVKNRIIENTSASSLEYGNWCAKNTEWEEPLEKKKKKNNFWVFEDSFHNCLKLILIFEGTLLVLEMWLPTAFSLKT